MFDLGWRLFSITAVLAIVKVKHAIALQNICRTSFQRDMAYDLIVPNDDNFYIDSFTGLDKIRCCQNCHHDRPNCLGFLYNRHQTKCRLLKRYLNADNKDGHIINDEWEYFRITGVCDESWQPFNGHCYFYIGLSLTWQAAQEHCQSLGSHLVDIRSPDEENWIKDITSSTIWIGGNDIENEGQFLWSWDKSALVYSNWFKGEPNNHNNEDCMVLTSSGWNDEKCSKSFKFLCKKYM